MLTAAEAARVAEVAAHSVSPATGRAYQSDAARWGRWCAGQGEPPWPADPVLVALYVQQHADLLGPEGGSGYAVATLARWISTLGRVNRALGAPAPGDTPQVRDVLAGVRRTRVAGPAARGPRRRAPLLLEDLTRLVTTIQDSAGTWAARVAARRDIAILTVGWAGAFRRSELAGLRWADLTYEAGDGVHVRRARSRTDQDGQGQVKNLPFGTRARTCPVCALLAWAQVVTAWDAGGRAGVIRLLHAPQPAGHDCRPGQGLPSSDAPVFRSVHRTGLLGGGLSGHAINELIARRAAAGLDPSGLGTIGGHSLRAGFVTEAFRAGAPAQNIARQTGHRSLTVLAGYQREHAPLVANAVTQVGL